MSMSTLPRDWCSKTVPSSKLQQLPEVMQVEQSLVSVSADVSSLAVNADGSHKQQAPAADDHTTATITMQQLALPIPAGGISGAGQMQIMTGCKREKKPSSGSGTVAAPSTTVIATGEPELKPYKRLRKKYCSPEAKEKQEQIKEKNVTEESTEQRKKYSSPEAKEKKEQVKQGKSVAVGSPEQRKIYSCPEANKKEHIEQGKSLAVESTDQRKKYSIPEEKEKQEHITKEKSVGEEGTEQRKKNSNPEEKEKQEQTKKGKGAAVESTEQRILRPRRATEDKQKNKGQNVSSSPLKVAHERADLKNNFYRALTKKEIEEDFLAITGKKPPQKPTKRPKSVTKHMDDLLGQGKTLRAVLHPKRYAVKEETSNKGKSFKQRFDEFIRSSEYEP